MRNRERVYRTQAVVLHRRDLGEADRLLTVYSQDRGKLRLVAKGVRRVRSRKAGHLEPFTRVQLLVACGRELDIITQAEAIELYPSLKEDLIQLGQAACVVELLDRFTVEREDNPNLYGLLVDTLERLSTKLDPWIVRRYFEIRLLDHSGYRPELMRCLGCGEDIRPQDQYFSSKEGGLLCPACGSVSHNAQPISLAAIKVLRYYQRNPFHLVADVRVRTPVKKEIERLMEQYLSYLLERQLYGPAFLRHVRRVN